MAAHILHNARLLTSGYEGVNTFDVERNVHTLRLCNVDADVSATDIVHVNAHGTSTPLGDLNELESITNALDGTTDHVVVTSTKSMTGHLLGGAGALESIFSVLSIHDRTVPPTINIENLDEKVTMDIASGATRELPQGDIAVLNNAFGFGGHDISVVFTSA